MSFFREAIEVLKRQFKRVVAGLDSMSHNSLRPAVLKKKRNGVYINLALCMMLAMTRKGSEYLGAREDHEDQE